MRWVILPLAFLLVAAQDGASKKDKPAADKSKGLSASALIGKATAEIQKLKGFHVKITSQSGQNSANFDGLVKKDGVAVTGAAEVYAKGASSLVKNGSSYVSPSELDVQAEPGRSAAAFRNPALQLAEIAEAGKAGGELAGDETVGEVEAKVARVSLSRAQKEKLVKELVSKVKLPVPVGDPMQFIDIDKTTADYKLWVSKADLRILKYELHAKPELKAGLPIPGGGGGGGGGPVNIELTQTVELSKFDEELDWSIPKPVQSKLGLK